MIVESAELSIIDKYMGSGYTVTRLRACSRLENAGSKVHGQGCRPQPRSIHTQNFVPMSGSNARVTVKQTLLC
jgi:hypothetical protein